MILKPLDGMGGMGIFRVKPDGMNLGSMIEMLERRRRSGRSWRRGSSRRSTRATSASS